MGAGNRRDLGGDRLSAFQFPVGGREQLDGIAQELLLRGFSGVLGAEESFVGGVLQQAAHQIGHAGQQGADGAIFADPVPALDEGCLQFVRHAKERLEFVGAGIDLTALGLRDGVGARADVVRGECRGDDVDVVQEKTGELLVVGVAFGLARPDRYGPGALLGEDGFEVPISAFHEPHG